MAFRTTSFCTRSFLRTFLLQNASMNRQYNICSFVLCPLSSHTNIAINRNSLFSVTTRCYAKSKDIKKDKGKKKVEINSAALNELVNVESLEHQMKSALEVMRNEYIKQLSLRSGAGSIESLIVQFDGKEHPLEEIAQIVRKPPKTVIVNMSTYPQAIPAALKAITQSGMNLNPQQDGTTLFIPIPKVTKEHRENLAKSAKSLFVKCRDSIRDVQNKHIKTLKKKSTAGEDAIRSANEQIVAIADSYIGEAEKLMVSKQSELLGS